MEDVFSRATVLTQNYTLALNFIVRLVMGVSINGKLTFMEHLSPAFAHKRKWARLFGYWERTG